jgi:periplasmic divalent cation tolerance protein
MVGRGSWLAARVPPQPKIQSSLMKPLIVMTTVGLETDALALGESFVEQRLAACVNVVGPIRSVYRWKGAVETESEQLLIIKTTDGRLAELREAIRLAHPYELPELIVIEPQQLPDSYASWLADAVL